MRLSHGQFFYLPPDEDAGCVGEPLHLLNADKVIPAMEKMRAFADEMEGYTAKKYWPFPTYGDILFSV